MIIDARNAFKVEYQKYGLSEHLDREMLFKSFMRAGYEDKKLVTLHVNADDETGRPLPTYCVVVNAIYRRPVIGGVVFEIHAFEQTLHREVVIVYDPQSVKNSYIMHR